MFHPCLVPLLLAILLQASGSIRAEPPLSLCPENGHYFFWRGKPTILVTSGEHYGAVLNLDYSFSASHPDGTLRSYKSPGGGSPELRRQLGILKRFLESLPFTQMKPDRTVVKTVSDRLTVTALSAPGKVYTVYLHVALPEKPGPIERYCGKKRQAALSLDLPAGRYELQWIDTKTGETLARENRDSAAAKALTSPEFVDDIALRVDAR
jgi:hypothetical protein